MTGRQNVRTIHQLVRIHAEAFCWTQPLVSQMDANDGSKCRSPRSLG